MKRGLSFLFFLLLYIIGYSNKIDSLSSLLNQTNGLNRAIILVDLSNAVVYNQTPAALEYAEEAYQLADEDGNDAVKYAALKAMGYANGYLGKFDVSLQNMKDGLAYYEEINDSVKIAEALSDVAYLLLATSSPEVNVMEYNLKALSIREKIGDQKGVAYSLNNIGALYWKWEKYDQAIDYFLQAIPYFERLNLTEEIATSTANIGAYYNEKGEYNKAKLFLNRALLKYRELGHKIGEAQTMSVLARLFASRGDLNKALDYNNQARLIREKIGDREGLVGNYYNIGYVFFKEGEYEKAKVNLTKSLEIAEAIGLIHREILINKTLSELSVKQVNYQAAYHYLLKSKELNDSIFSVEKHRQLEEIKSKYDVEKKEAENRQLLVENENQKLTLERNKLTLYLLIGGTFLVIVIMYLGFQRYRTKEKLKAVTSEQRLLRSQMNPHFIFNAITAIQSYIFNHSPKEAISYLSSFAALMRQILDSSLKEFVSIESEVQLLKNYFLLQQLRYSDKFDYQIEIDQNIDIENTLIPPMLNQPFAENAIEHGFKTIEYKGEIFIKYRLINNLVMVEIADNGIGILKGRQTTHTGHKSFAMAATEDRLKAIQKRNKTSFQFEIIDKSELPIQQTGTIVRYSIPYVNNL